MKEHNHFWMQTYILVLFIIFFVVLFTTKGEYDNLEDKIDALETDVMEHIGYSPKNINNLLSGQGLKLECADYEQVSVLKFNVTCWWYSIAGVTDEGDIIYEHTTKSFISSDIVDCEIDNTLSIEPIITTENGACLEYKIIKGD